MVAPQLSSDSESGNGLSPEGVPWTTLERNLSIFMVALRHAVSKEHGMDWQRRLQARGWALHPQHVCDGRGKRSLSTQCVGNRAFSPEETFTRAALEGILGRPLAPLGEASSAKMTAGRALVLDGDLIAKRLDSSDRDAPGVQTLLLTLDPSGAGALLDTPLEVVPDPRKPLLRLRFKLDWVDLWLFNDSTAVLAFKTVLLAVLDKDTEKRPTLQHLSEINRCLRSFSDWDVTVRRTASAESSERHGDALVFWEELVFGRWLGLGSRDDVLMLYRPVSLRSRLRALLHRDEDAPAGSLADWCVDRYTRYAKLLTAAQVPSVAEGVATQRWNLVQSDIPYDFKADLSRLSAGQWVESARAYQAASQAGFATWGDLLLFDLATTGNEGTAAGMKGRDWQPSPDYVREVFKEGQIEIWEYWRGLALHDVLAFLAYDESMPLLGRDQVESRYYPLYLHAYHLKYRLHRFSEEVIDPEMSDILRAHKVLDAFQRFRNQFWFQEVAADFQGVHVYSRVRKGTRLDELYAAVSHEVSEASAFVERKVQGGRQMVIGFLLAAIVPFQYLVEVTGLGNSLLELAARNRLQATGVVIGFLLFLVPLMLLGLRGMVAYYQRLVGWAWRHL